MKTITSELPTWVEEANDLSNDRIKWDWLQFKIKMSSIAFSKKISREIAQRRPWGWHGVGVLKPLGLFSLIIQLFNDKLKDIQTQTRLWSCRGLSLFGKITIIKSFLLSKMLYIFSFLPTPEACIKQLNTIIYNFLWKGPDKVA